MFSYLVILLGKKTGFEPITKTYNFCISILAIIMLAFHYRYDVYCCVSQLFLSMMKNDMNDMNNDLNIFL